MDTKVVLYSDENQLGEDDDSGSESNFSLKASLEAGKTYRYIANYPVKAKTLLYAPVLSE